MKPRLEISVPTVDRSGRPIVVWLGAPGSAEVELTGAKAASLARSSAAGLPGAPKRQRLTGCLTDATIDRVRGDVASIVHEPAA